MEQATAAAVPIKDPIRLKVAGMDCGSCALTIESSLRQLAGVQAASVSFTTETLEVSGDIEVDAIASRLKELGYRIADTHAGTPPIVPEHRGLKGFLRFLWEQPTLRRGLIVAAAVLAGIAVIPAFGIGPVLGIPSLTLVFGIAVLVAGAPIFVKGLRSLIFARRVTIDLLMAIAACGAIGIGETGEAITVILLFLLGEALEAYSAERARDSLRSLMSLQPQEATVLETHVGHHGDPDHGADGHTQHEHHTVKPVEQVAVGDRVLVRPGERIPVDGQIIKGMSSVNQAPVTGEDMPVLKAVGDDVMAGTVNGEAAIEVHVSRLASEGTIARIAKLVEQAQAQRSPAERFIDRFARYYTPAVVVIAILIVAIPVLAFSAPFLDTADGTRGWLYRGLTLLIIACPCALVISIPVTVVSGLTRLAQLGVLVKSGALLDRMADIRTIAFDKTGTLTRGKPIVTSMRTADCAHDASQYDECDPCDATVVAAASVERASEHPVAHAIVAAAGNRASGHVAMAQDVQAHPGQGVSGVLEDGARVTVGNRGLFDHTEEGWDSVAAHADAAENDGETIMYVSHNDKVIGYIGVQDEIREGSNAVLAELANMQPPIRTVMLTGDNPQSAARVADRLDGIDEIRAGLLPAEKLAGIEALRSDGAAVAMVGDGINDAPALARADIGIAMGGSGTAQAMETADVVLMQDDLSQVALALRIARRARYVIKQNIALSLILKLVFIALAIPGIATLWMAVLADVGATLLVTLNGMRLLRQR
jgi:Cd2+/Zn2+-exporting ATPase